MEARTVHDPFTGQDVQISNRLVDRLRGKYASGPHLPNGKPEFGWKQFQAPPIQHEAAERIEALEAALRRIYGAVYDPEGMSDAKTLDLVLALSGAALGLMKSD